MKYNCNNCSSASTCTHYCNGIRYKKKTKIKIQDFIANFIRFFLFINII